MLIVSPTDRRGVLSASCSTAKQAILTVCTLHDLGTISADRSELAGVTDSEQEGVRARIVVRPRQVLRALAREAKCNGFWQ